MPSALGNATLSRDSGVAARAFIPDAPVSNRQVQPVLIKLPEIELVNDNVEKPAAIQKFIGRRLIAAFGNSDGDLEMLQWTAAGTGARFALLIHHNDAIREFAYDRTPSIGQLDEANVKGWTVVDMKNDWRSVFPFE